MLLSEADMTIANALTINVEDYFQASAFKRSIQQKDWPLLTPHIESSVNKILEMLSDHDAKATFFVYAWTAQRFPALIKLIAQQGHELALRYHQDNCQHLQKQPFIQEIKQGRCLLANLSGNNISGFRSDAQLFSLENEWLYDELMLANYDYSSGVVKGHKFPEQWQLLDHISDPRIGFQELPTSSHSIFGKNWDIVNENTLRIRPYDSTEKLIHNHHDETQKPLIASIASWTVDNEQPAIRGDTLLAQWLHQHNTSKAPILCHQLLAEFSWQTMQSLFINKVCSLHTLRKRKRQISNR